MTKKYDPLAYRYLTLTCHYRSQLNFSWESFEAANKALNRLKITINSYPSGGKGNDNYLNLFIDKIMI